MKRQDIMQKHIDAMMRELADAGFQPAGLAGGVVYTADREGEGSDVDIFSMHFAKVFLAEDPEADVNQAVIDTVVSKLQEGLLATDVFVYVSGPSTQQGGVG
jgi:predicted nucleotidyltransferase